MSLTIRKSAFRRSGDVGMDLPAGASARTLNPLDYHPVDMEPEDHVEHGMVGMDLPAGASASQLKPEDYRPIETEPAQA